MSNVTCQRHEDPGASGLASLASVLAHHGASVTVDEAAALAGVPLSALDLSEMVQVASRLGLDATPLEGSYEDLPACEFPIVVPLASVDKTSLHSKFVVVYKVDEEGVLVADSERGVITLTCEEFCRAWVGPEGTGDVLALSPRRAELATLRNRLEEFRDPWRALRVNLGLVPPWPRKLAFLGAVVTVLVLLGPSSGISLPWRAHVSSRVVTPLTVALGFSFLCALWSKWFTQSCSSCSSARAAIGGLPVAAMGAFAYGGLFVYTLFASNLLPTAVVLSAAVGVHASLLLVLQRNKVVCRSCILTALSVLVAFGLSFVSAALTPLAMASLAGLAAVGSWQGFALARRYAELAAEAASRDLALSVVSETPPPNPGRVRIVVYKRHNCPLCVFYESVIAPALRQDFAGVMELEERDAGSMPIAVPLLIVIGNVPIVLRGLMADEYAAVRKAVVAALQPGVSELGTLPGLYMLESPKRSDEGRTESEGA